MRLDEIHLRDPYVWTEQGEGCYYLYGTTGTTAWDGKAAGFDAYRSKDLVEWEGPFPVFRPAADFWADRHFWAPEVHRYRGRYYMFASFKAEDRHRATQILTADHPLGPFVPHGDGPATPRDWECLDGTLFLDDDGAPWIVFCHEWTQIRDGEICAMRLTPELDGTLGEPVTLFKSSDAYWPVEAEGKGNFVTDGPFLVRADDGALLMMWSSHAKEGYAIGMARSLSGGILGPWEQEPELLFEKDGGHGMLFRTLEGQLLLSMHKPNLHPQERPVFFPVLLRDGKLQMGDEKGI
ncbi:glycoside hydrolase family 43 protein [Gorillibacterium massiliense]|uniref:glycoside hydrolase family 43 protein n=1 Tax=Gorillibacterium massiliense TaxID=1280390 RepID=UPI0004B4F74F|nr:glycoside hydrolase family 43 protein [Gorillibacterium massiliense]